MSIAGNVKISEQLQDIADALSKLLDEVGGEHVLFALHVFGEGDEHRAQYVANCKREDVAAAMRQLLDRWETAGADDGKYHTYHKAH